MLKKTKFAKFTDHLMEKEEFSMDINAAASNAGSVKAVLDVPILTEDGALTEASGEITEKIGKLLYK